MSFIQEVLSTINRKDVNLIVTNVLTTQRHSTITPKSKLHCLNLSIFLKTELELYPQVLM